MASHKSSSLPRDVPESIRTLQSTSNIRKNNYQDEEASKDSELKAIWDEQISSKNLSVAYREAHVLLLSWHPDDDDLHVEQEVAELENVFKNTFKYQTTQKILKQDPKKHPQTQINLYLAEFVHSHDDPNNLLIVYYAGHGKLRDGEEGLALTGSTTIPDEENELHEIVWSSAEHNIQNTQSDVLVIFDCCNAGEMDRNVRGSDFSRRAFEYMAATSQRSTTKKPGPQSFTVALIWALNSMVLLKPGKRFSTHELLRKINQAPKFPKDQAPRLTERGPLGSLRKIVLVPLDQQSKPEALEEKSMEMMDEVKQTLSLQYVFNREITEKMIRDLAQDTLSLISQGDFVASTVIWGGTNTSRSTKQKLRDVVSHWQNHARNRNRASNSSMDRPQISPISPMVPQGSLISPEESIIVTPSPDRLLPSPAPEIGLDVGGISGRDVGSDVPKKRKRENETIQDLKAVDARSKLPTPREKRQKSRQSGVQRT